MDKSKQQETFISIADLWRLCTARWRWFVLSVGACLMVAGFYLYKTPYTYTRTAAVMVIEENAGQSTGSDGSGLGGIGFVNRKRNVINVMRHMTSLDVLTEVVHQLHPEMPFKEMWDEAKEVEARFTAEVEDMQGTVIDLTYRDYSTIIAAKTLGLIIDVYNEKVHQEKLELTKQTSAFIDARLKLLEHDLDVVDDSIAVYKSRYGITNLEHVSDIYLQEQSRADNEILTLTNQKAMAEYIRSLLADKEHPQLLLVNSGINNAIIEEQVTLYNTLLLQLQSHLDYTTEQNPLIINQQKELASLRNNILANVNNHIRTIDIQLLGLRGYHGEAAQKIMSNPAQAKYLESIQRDKKVKESLYLYLLQKKEENEISVTYESSNIYVIDPPHGAGKPTAPNRPGIILAAMMLGLLAPVTFLFLRASFDESVRDHFDIEANSDIPFLGEVPYSGREHSLENVLMRFGKGRKAQSSGIVVGYGKLDASNEAFRVLRNNMETIVANKALGQHGRVYIVKSTQIEAGKTYVAMNLALTKAIGRRHVLFIDGDLRQASASRLWRTPLLGLTDYLSGDEEDFHRLLCHPEEYDTLDVLPAGALPLNPIELLRSSRLKRLLDQARQEYDAIIIDSPSAGMLADADIIEHLADCTLFVIRAGRFHRRRLYELKPVHSRDKQDKMQYVVLNGVSVNVRYGGAYLHKYERTKKDVGTVELTEKTILFNKIIFRKPKNWKKS